jgi:hypothetical protein
MKSRDSRIFTIISVTVCYPGLKDKGMTHLEAICFIIAGGAGKMFSNHHKKTDKKHFLAGFLWLSKFKSCYATYPLFREQHLPHAALFSAADFHQIDPGGTDNAGVICTVPAQGMNPGLVIL